METGTVVQLTIDRGYGFIRAAGRDLFFHCKTLDPGLPFDETLRERRVLFDSEVGDRGERATLVQAAE